MKKTTRFLLVAGNGLLALILFTVSAYFAFSSFVRKGETSVPPVIGLDREQAGLALDAAGLKLEVAEEGERFDEKVPPDHVMRQDPRPDSFVKRGSAVRVVISRGAELVDMPDLRGKAVQAAQVTLSASGLALERVANIYSDSRRPGEVVEQNPKFGQQVDRSTGVQLFLNVDNVDGVFVMPDLVYQDYERARRILDSRGFRFGSVKFEPYEGIAPGTVLRQFPLPGHPLRKRDVISMVVATLDGFES